MNGKSLFVNNFLFKKNRNDEKSNYKKVGSLNLFKNKDQENLNADNLIIDKKEEFRVPSKHVLSADQITIDKELGKGEFGIVQQGVWTNDANEKIQVAIKCLSKQRINNNSMEFLKEAAIMHSIAHPNIVRLYGVVLDCNSLMLVTELAPLKSLLECLKDPAIKLSFTISSLCDFAYQICDGMQYLEKKRLIHRDLAARNILVFAKNLVKISDFGLSRALGVGKDYYQTNFNENLRLPIAWCAPECINYLKFTSYSDVWSYGVTLWEMFSYGFEPWIAFTGKQILEAIDEPNFQRLKQPDHCPKEYYSIMLKCWEHDPLKRPKFNEIINMLPDLKPELVQAVKDTSDFGDLHQITNFINFKVGDIITVLDKNPSIMLTADEYQQLNHNGTFWKGCLNNGKVGFFDPSKTVAYLGLNLPSCSSMNIKNNVSSNNTGMSLTVFLKSFLEKNTNNLNSNTLNNSKKKIRTDMISKPQGDLKHTGHVGADGAFFGDISCLGDKYQLLPKQVVNPYKPINDSLDKDSLSRNSSVISDKTPLLKNKALLNESVEKLITKETIKPTLSLNCNINNDHEYHEISDEDGLCSPKFKPLNFEVSLVDEIFREFDFGLGSDFGKDLGIKNFSENNNKLETPKEKNNHSNSTLLPTKKKQALVKPISASEQQSLDSAIAMVKGLATKPMFHFDSKDKTDSLSLLNNSSFNCESPRFITSPTKKKFNFIFKSNKESKTFSDTLNNKQNENIEESIVSQQAKEAYESLVESGSKKNTNSLKKSEVKDTKSKQSKFFDNSLSKGKNLASKVISRSSLPAPPPIPKPCSKNLNGCENEKIILPKPVICPLNPIPLPPRDRSKNFMYFKHHERRHPLILPVHEDHNNGIDSVHLSINNQFCGENQNYSQPIMSTFKPNMPLNRNSSFNEATKQQNLINSSQFNPTINPTLIQTSNFLSEKKCSQIPVNMFTGLPINRDEDPKSPIIINNKDIIEFTFENRNIKIDLSKLKQEEPDEVRLMQKVLANAHQVQITSEDCLSTLKKTNWNVYQAIKIIQLKESLKTQSINVDCDLVEILTKSNWHVKQAETYLISNQTKESITTV